MIPHDQYILVGNLKKCEQQVVDLYLATTGEAVVLERRRAVMKRLEQSTAKANKRDPETNKMFDFYVKTGNMKAVAAEFEMTTGAVRSRLKNYGYPTRLYGRKVADG